MASGTDDRKKKEIDRATDLLMDRLRHVDPETPRQWQILRTRMDALPAAQEEAAPAMRPAAAPARWIPGWILRPALAVGALLVIFIAGRLWLGEGPAAREYATSRGERSAITLPDSSEVILNFSSRVRVEGPRNSRLVDLQGEAFFRVRKNGSPFIVSTPAGNVEVLGTEFNVRVRENRFEVAVVSGTVRVSAVGTRSRATVLPAGTMIAVEKGELLPLSPEPNPFAEYPGWLHRQILFQRAPVLSVCREIEGMFDVAVRVEAKKCSTETISGSLDSRNAESALATVAQLTGTRVRHDATGYIIY